MATADTFGLVGQIIDSQLRMEEAIGEGGFSLVYKATHLGLGEPVAVKCLKLPSGIDYKLVPSFTQRFREESRLCYRLSQGNLDIVRSMTSGSTVAPLTGELVPYMALEWLEGTSLVTDLQDRRARGLRGRPLEEVVRMFTSAANAVAYAHSQGVIHRDLKPGNLFLASSASSPSGQRMKVLDFGLAKIMNDEAIGMTSNVKTMAPFFFCSPSYGAPEQFDPTLGELGPWTDVYAFAMVLVEALCDAKARPVTNVAEALAAAMDPRNKPTPRAMGIDLGQEMERIFGRALSLQPKQRWPNASVFWEEFRAAAAELPPMTTRLPEGSVLDPRIPGPPRLPGEGRGQNLPTMKGMPGMPASTRSPAAAPAIDSNANFTPGPPPFSNSSAVAYKIPAADLPVSVAEIRVDPELIQSSVRPSAAPMSLMPVASPKPRTGVVIGAMLFALAVTVTVVGGAIHFFASGFGDADAAETDSAPPPPRALAPAASMHSSTGAPPMVTVEKAQPPPVAPKTH